MAVSKNMLKQFYSIQGKSNRTDDNVNGCFSNIPHVSCYQKRCDLNTVHRFRPQATPQRSMDTPALETMPASESQVARSMGGGSSVEEPSPKSTEGVAKPQPSSPTSLAPSDSVSADVL